MDSFLDKFLDRFFRQERFERIKKEISVNSVVCDLGCGKDAQLLKSIAGFFKGGIGLVGAVENYRDSKLDFRNVKIEKNLPLDNESCDIITIAAFLEHLSYPQEVLNECFRCLKPLGKLIITAPTPLAKPILEFLAFNLNLIDRKEISDHKNYFWPKNLKQMLSRAGFNGKNVKSHFFELFFNSLIVAQR